MRSAATDCLCLTPPQLAKRWSVSPAKVLGWIRRGELAALNLADTPSGKRPRWRVTPEVVQQFEASRLSPAARPQAVRRKRPARSDVIQFY
jgi:hypothetical protein